MKKRAFVRAGAGFLLAALLPMCAVGADTKYTLVADSPSLTPGGKATFTLDGTPPVSDFKLSADPSVGLTCDDTAHKCTAPVRPDGANGQLAITGSVKVTAKGSDGKELASTTINLAASTFDAEPGGAFEARAIIGYHQAGAASSDFSQNVIVDLYLVRNLTGKEPVWNSHLNSWGSIRIASTPRQLNTPLVSLLQGLVVGGDNSPLNTNVNELALGAEFQTGLEWLPKPNPQGRALGLIAFFGATGTFQSPDKSIRIYQVPDPSSPQAALFKSTFPSVGNATYVGFVTPDRDRFYRQYGAGFRYSQYRPGPLQYQAPQTFSVSLGQDELITGGRLRSVVARFDGFYPLPIDRNGNGKYQFLYLFGTVSLRLSRADNITPFVLASAPPTIKGSENNVAIVSTPSNRDTYRIGIGVDLVNLIRSAVLKQ